jgi:hypothetical protein
LASILSVFRNLNSSREVFLDVLNSLTKVKVLALATGLSCV